MKKNFKFATLTLIAFLLLSLASLAFVSVKAQGQATVNVLAATGGTTDKTGTNNYPDGTEVTITATPFDNYAFVGWTITTDSDTSNSFENPLVITVTGGTTYTIQPNYQVIQAPPGGNLPPANQMSTAAIVVVLAAAGGTTSPAPGTYAIANAENLWLNATANSGWKFSHWTICGQNMNHGGAPVDYAPTTNPYNVNHGYGYTYYYQPVFTKIGSTEPTPAATATPTPATVIGGITAETAIIIALVIIIILMLIGFGLYTRKNKKQ
jgi:hypothetical protein